MRKVIIGLSVLFFTLSAIITFKALGISGSETRYERSHLEANSHDEPSAPEKVSGQPAGKQGAGQASVEELQATIAKLENELSSKKEEVRAGAVNGGVGKKARVLAVLGEGTFNPGQVIINENQVSTVEELVPEILSSPDQRVVIEGHTDNTPISASAGKRFKDNVELSFLRAKAVADILVGKGIPFERISVIGYGDTRPIDTNDTDEGKLKNRRVEVKLVPQEKEF